MLNKRKAFIGYVAYVLGKPLAKRAVKSKAKGAVPGTRAGSRMPNVPAIVAGAGALAGGLLFWRRRRSDDEPSSES